MWRLKRSSITRRRSGGPRDPTSTARKTSPVQDVMAAGGWRDVKALQDAYQGADPKTIRQVVELGETG